MVCVMYLSFFLFFKQKTAYEMRISDWSSNVCSSDLAQCVSHHHTSPLPFSFSSFPLFLLRIENERRAQCNRQHRRAGCTVVHRAALFLRDKQIGSASCRERVCQYV